MKKKINLIILASISIYAFCESTAFLDMQVMTMEKFEERYGLFGKIVEDTQQFYNVDLYYKDDPVYAFNSDDFLIKSIKMNQRTTIYLIILAEERARYNNIPTKLGFFIMTYENGPKIETDTKEGDILLQKNVFYELKEYFLFEVNDPMLHSSVEILSVIHESIPLDMNDLIDFSK